MVSLVHAYGFDPCWRHQRCLVTEASSGLGFVTTSSHRCVCVLWYTAPAVVHTRYDLCHSQCITVPRIHIPLEVSSIDNVCPVNSGSRVHAFWSWVILEWFALSSRKLIVFICLRISIGWLCRQSRFQLPSVDTTVVLVMVGDSAGVFWSASSVSWGSLALYLAFCESSLDDLHHWFCKSI